MRQQPWEPSLSSVQGGVPKDHPKDNPSKFQMARFLVNWPKHKTGSGCRKGRRKRSEAKRKLKLPKSIGNSYYFLQSKSGSRMARHIRAISPRLPTTADNLSRNLLISWVWHHYVIVGLADTHTLPAGPSPLGTPLLSRIWCF